VSDEVVGLGVWCDFVPEEQSMNSPGSVSFTVHEFAVLANGARLTLHTDRGFAVSGPIRPTVPDPLASMTAEDIEAHARTTVMPEDVDTKEEHPYDWLCDLLSQHGIAVSADSLRAVPYTVEFGSRLQHLLAK
jgi:hypothetical protein